MERRRHLAALLAVTAVLIPVLFALTVCVRISLT
jgi:hypothetical protein